MDLSLAIMSQPAKESDVVLTANFPLLALSDPFHLPSDIPRADREHVYQSILESCCTNAIREHLPHATETTASGSDPTLQLSGNGFAAFFADAQLGLRLRFYERHSDLVHRLSYLFSVLQEFGGEKYAVAELPDAAIFETGFHSDHHVISLFRTVDASYVSVANLRDPNAPLTYRADVSSSSMGQLQTDLSWVQLKEPVPFFGKMRLAIYNQLDTRFGRDGWKLGWNHQGNVVDHGDALKLYEQSYVHYFSENPAVLAWLTNTASDVYDTGITNMFSGRDYSRQEGRALHLQDIAIRRAVDTLGRHFEGGHFVQVRGKETEGGSLSPGRISFYDPGLIIPVDQRPGWWGPKSVEAFYQQNKVLMVREDRLSHS